MNNLFEYIKYRWNAKSRHGIHSPFVYDLTDRCFKITIDEAFMRKRKQLFKTLRHNKSVLNIKDLGAGSKKLSEKRMVSTIFKVSSSKGKYADLLYRISAFYKPQTILELGTSLGTGTIHLSKGNPASKITTIEGCPQTRKEALKTVDFMQCENIECIESDFKSFIANEMHSNIDLLYIDGHHDGEALKTYLNQLDMWISNDTLILLDDIRWSNSMYQAWKEIISEEKYHVSIDLFRMGLIMKRSQQEKEHFILNY